MHNIKKCTCIHKFQDKVYGEGMRVHTPINSDSNTYHYRCTVCKTER